MLKTEIEVFEKLQNQISNIEQKLREAADYHDIRDNQLEEVDKLLTEVDREVLLPLGEKLVNFQTNLMDTSDENEKAIRSNETLKLIENFVEKAEKVLQVEVSEVTSLQNKVDSFSVGEDEEVSPKSRERHVSYATYKSSQMIREHLKLHKYPERNETLVSRLSWAHLQPWVVPAIPVVVLVALVLGLVAWRCSCRSRGSSDLQ